MEHAGILAHSVEGAALCLRAFAAEGFRELGPHAHPRVTLDCIPLAESMSAWGAGDYCGVRSVLSRSAAALAAAGATFFACPDNAAHLALEQPGEPLPLPGLHIAAEVVDAAASEGRRRVGILGTRFIMEGWMYPRALAGQGIESRVPGDEDRAIVDRIIFDELVNGVISDASRREYVRVIESFRRDGCDAVAWCVPRSRSSSPRTARRCRFWTRPACSPARIPGCRRTAAATGLARRPAAGLTGGLLEPGS